MNQLYLLTLSSETLLSRANGAGIQLQQEVLTDLAKQLGRGIQQALHYEPNQRTQDFSAVVTARVVPSIFLQAIWTHVPASRREKWAGVRSGQTYKASLASLEEVVHLFGYEVCKKYFPRGSKTLLSPRAQVTRTIVPSTTNDGSHH